tara:strand:- start:75 stop:770 length:696 start_codon:yes stop_codon:yes gene_type:complete
MLKYLKEKVRAAQKNNREQHLFGSIVVYIKDPLSDVALEEVLGAIEQRVPRAMFHNVDAIYVGDFKEFHVDNRDFNALYKDGAIYVSNDQSDIKDMVDDIVHEAAHSLEESRGEVIYGDGRLRDEFLAKRESLYRILKVEGYDPSYRDCLNLQYDKNFDYYLYQVVGYPTLTNLTMGLFYSPYAATSLREYFANGFEHYFLEDRQYLKKISPVLYNKIINLIQEGERQGEF